MSLEIVKATLPQTNLQHESADYVKKREELRHAELELMRQREKVAALRRALPQGATVHDYTFEEGPADLAAGDAPIRTVRLSELFSAPGRALIVYHLMFGKRQATPCPMCTGLIDGFNGNAIHLAENVDLAIVAAADPAALRAHARTRGWDKLRLLSSGSSNFKYDLGSEDREGNQDSEISVFTRDADGTVRHFYSAHPKLASGVNERGLDLLWSLWNLLDLTPQGRPNWYAKLDYPEKAQASHA
ncbi:MAG TPA: DUF899 family protein [Candidatus Acidoferrales bacterium]|nr:DUF899 family protein [Candidatus Acidoferrales bacterium]